MWLSLPFLLLFLQGYATIAALSYFGAEPRRRSRLSTRRPLHNEALLRG
jgi:hypothetical protein